MGSLFSKKPAGPPKPQITKKDEAILQLKVQTDNMKKYQARVRSVLPKIRGEKLFLTVCFLQLEIVVEKETQAAKSLALAGKQRQAILALKKKKYQEALINKTDNMLLNLQEMV
jgi:charged multivesicular body protein 6